MAELIIPDTYRYSNSPNWWSKFFYSCGDWRGVDRVLARDWNAQVNPSTKLGEVGTIVFENEQDLTMFLLRWS